METDGGVAFVMTSLDRARDLPQRPVRFLAAAQGITQNLHLMTSYYVDDVLEHPEMVYVARQLWQQSGLRPSDLDLMIAYDHFSASVIAQLEAYGICGRGEATAFVADGNIGRGGILPVNPHGGQLGEAYLHGMNGIQEAVRQLRGSAVNQVHGANIALVSGPQGQPTSGLVLEAA
jgi:acetyl-CoA acetyltransferase